MKKNIFIIICLFLFNNIVNGQISTQETPVSFRTDISAVRANEMSVRSFASLDMERIKREDENDKVNGVPPRFGYKYEVNYNLDNSGEWIALPDGDKLWRLTISCQGALSINLLYDKFWLPTGAKFFIYSNDRKHSIGAFTSINNKGNKDNIQGFATGLVYGDQITLEYYQPKELKEIGIISVAYVVHGYRYIVLPENMEAGYGESGNCQVNVNCSEGRNWRNEKNAVAMILVNGNRYCTGSLVNTTSNDYRPLFLTADHCLGGWASDYVKYDAIGNSDLSHWSFYWHYEAPGCTDADPTIVSTSGATVISNNGASDFALLQLSEDPLRASGVNPYYLGWDRSGIAGMGGVGIHHPSGDLKKIATYNITPPFISNCFSSSGNRFWRINWMQTSNGYSVTEGGSSGSPLINSNRHVIGQLFGQGGCDNRGCRNPSRDIANYGKFSVSWTGNGATDARRRLKDWLDPNNTGEQTINGVKGCHIAVVNNVSLPITLPVSLPGLPPITITTLPVNDCQVEISNTTVKNGGTLNATAESSITLLPGFNVELGGEFTATIEN